MKFNVDLISEFLPIKLVGGFITIDSHIGCLGCRFCLSRRHPIRNNIFNSNFHSEFDISPQEVKNILLSMPSFYEAKVPLRIGHDTDAGLEYKFAIELIKKLPADNPIIYMKRTFFNQYEIDFFKKYRKNVIIKLTITPPSRILGIFTNYKKLIEQAQKLKINIFYLIGPLIDDNFEESYKILKILPKNSIVDIKELTIAGIDNIKCLTPLSDEKVVFLKNTALKLGLKVTKYFGCIIRQKLYSPFYKVHDIDEIEKIFCKDCPNFQKCFNTVDEKELFDKLEFYSQKIGLHFLKKPEKLGYKFFKLYINEDTSRGDETYLSEITGVKVRLNTVEEGSMGGACVGNSNVLKRWENAGFFPYTKLKKYAIKIIKVLEKNNLINDKINAYRTGQNMQRFSCDRKNVNMGAAV